MACGTAVVGSRTGGIPEVVAEGETGLLVPPGDPVALARALVLKPKLLLADEPTGNLDPATGEAIHELLFEVNQKRGITAVIATHNLALANRMPRRFKLADGLVTE